jgi:hypothetical protein
VVIASGIPVSLIEAPTGMFWLRPFLVPVGCVPMWNPTPHWRPSQAAWPDHSGLMSIATNKAEMNMRSTQGAR